MNLPGDPGQFRAGFRLLEVGIEPDLDRITRDGVESHLEPKLTEVLLFLAENQGRVVSKERILEAVWPNQFVTENSLTHAIADLRRAFGDDAQAPRFIETIPRRGYRLIAPVTPCPPTVSHSADPAAPIRARRTRWRSGLGLALIAALGIFAVGLVLYSRAAAPALSDKDVVLIADFENTTGNLLFDDTLKQAFVIGIEQSPYFSLFPTERVRSTLEMMKRSPDERVTPALAREICERNGVAAMLVGSLAPLGGSYVITLQAISARTGETLAREQAQAVNKESIVTALGSAASKLRRKLGESRASIERFDKPLAEVTTSSLEALRFFTEGARLVDARRFDDGIRFYRKALELDPEFARAHFSIGVAHNMAGNWASAWPAIVRAYELRDRVTERERYFYTYFYLEGVEKDLLAARENVELAVQAYPRYVRFRTMLASAYATEGRYEEAAEQAAEAIRLQASTPGWTPYLYHAQALLYGGRYDETKRTLAEARLTLDEAQMSRFEHAARVFLLKIAFVEGDRPAIRRELDWSRDQDSRPLAFIAAEMELFEGRRGLQAVAEVSDEEIGGLAMLAADSAALGDCDGARALLHRIPGDAVDWAQAVAFALCGNVEDARQTLTRLYEEPHGWPVAGLVSMLPAVEATLEQSRGNFTLARAKLEPALKYELGWNGRFWATYLLGLGHLGERRSGEAATAFEKILAHRSVDLTSPLYPLSYLGLARASTLSGDTARARRAYEDLFAIWNQADPDLPALVAARAEYNTSAAPLR